MRWQYFANCPNGNHTYLAAEKRFENCMYSCACISEGSFYKAGTLSLGGFNALAPSLARRNFLPVGLNTRLKNCPQETEQVHLEEEFCIFHVV
jgi:hypothetical protein